MKFCCKDCCDFVVWRKGELVVQRIYPDEIFVSSALAKSEQFIKVAILPEILGKWYSKEPIMKPDEGENNGAQNNEVCQLALWCYCRKVESGEMIGCDDTKCPIQWFHTSCLRITKIPRGRWFCPDCRKQKRRK